MKRGLLVLAALAAGAGCMGASDDVEGATSAAVSVPSDTEVLGHVRSDSWMYVADTCEDRLPDHAEFRLVSGDLLLALDESGEPVCTDAVDDIQEELIETGRVEESRRLGDSYLLTVGIAIPVHRGDPSPQPSIQDTDQVAGATGARGTIRDTPDDQTRAGDPSPQPSTQEHRAEVPPTM
ncbi:MAG: hypothetical protein R3B82_01840 [Sandaracinaceae bacterium]